MDLLTNNTFVSFGDLDASPTKAYQIKNRHAEPRLYELGYETRPAEELYVLKNDSDEVCNVAYWSRYAKVRRELSDKLMAELERLGDPRVTGDRQQYEKPPFAGL